MSAGLVVRLSWTANEPSALLSAGVCCCPKGGEGKEGRRGKGRGGEEGEGRGGEGKGRRGVRGRRGGEGGSEGTVEMERGGLLAMTWLPCIQAGQLTSATNSSTASISSS